METLTEEDKLINLLNDMDQIEDQLSEWLDDTNIFQILKLSRTEIRHSNFLAYLFNPRESHNWQDYFFKAMMKSVIQEAESEKLDYFDLVLNNYNDLIVYREHYNIDLLMVSEKNKVVMAVENKIGASESKHQLAKYENYVKEHFPNYTNLFVFLTPENEEASSSIWTSISYYQVIEMIERLIKHHGLDPKIEYLVNDYLNSLRRDVIVDERLQQICSKIYSQHQEALDLIFENKPDNLMIMSQLYTEAVNNLEKEGLIIFDPNHSGKSIIRFQIQQMNDVFPDLPLNNRGGWGNHKSYAFEILNRDAKSSGKIKLAFTGRIDENKRAKLEQTLRHFDKRNKKSTWDWWTLGDWKIKKVNTRFVEEIISKVNEGEREDIVAELTNSLREQLTGINNFCERLIKTYHEQLDMNNEEI